jgi:hypothetical protein
MTALILSTALLLLQSEPAPPTRVSAALSVDEELRRLAARPLWPGFDPARIPLAVFDGERTFLFRHPKPPVEFQAVPGRAGTAFVAGRHALLTANSSITLGGVRTATLLLDSPKPLPPRAAAAIAVHEAFHVFQAERHPGWGANEVDLFTYPVDDAVLLQLSRLETQALVRALAEKSAKKSGCWAAAALDLRRRRFAALGETGASYERGTEKNEGLARLVESRAEPPDEREPVFPANEFAAGDVRSRSYAVGHAFGLLLDRFDAGWESKLESGADRPLDALLSEALAREAVPACRFPESETARALEGAKRSVDLARLTREAMRDDFLRRDGWTLVVVAEGEPLAPQGFDPLNVERLGPGEVLHSRWVKLGNGAGSVEVLNARAVTESAGKHPLFEGVRRVTVTGIRDEPKVDETVSGVSIDAAGVAGKFAAARAERSGRTITVRLSKGP